MFNKIIIAALAFASTAYGIGLTNEYSEGKSASCVGTNEPCEHNRDCCGWGAYCQ